MSDEIKLHHDLRLDYLRRAKVCFKACENIPTSALEAGVVEKMIKYIKGEPRSRCFRCCDVMPDGCPDCELGQIMKLLEESK